MESTEDILSADKLLFAIDLVDHVIIKTRPNFGNKTERILAQADQVRNFTYNRFTKTIKRGLYIIDINQDSSVYSDFEKMMNEKKVNKESFTEYANNYRTQLPEEFNGKSFLMYCDRVANMAGYFLSLGVDDAPEVAVELIMQAFPQSVMYHGTWNKLTKVAEALEVIGNDYFGDDISSDDSCSDNEELISSGNEDSTSGSVSMDMNASSPEDMSRCNLDMGSSTLEKTTGNIASKANLVYRSPLGDTLNSQSSDSVSSSIVFSFKYSSSESPASLNEIDTSKSDL